MKRTAALQMWDAIKLLRKAQKGVGPMWPDWIQLHISGLERMLLIANQGEFSSLLDDRALADLQKERRR